MRELKFKDLIVKYDDTELSEKAIKKTKRMEKGIMVSLVLYVLVFLGLFFLLLSIGGILNQTGVIVLSSLIMLFPLLFMVGTSFQDKTYEKVVPKHYHLVTMLMKFKENEVMLDVCGKDLAVEVLHPRYGWTKKELGLFVKSTYILKGSFEEMENVYMVIDLTKTPVEIVVEKYKNMEEQA